MTTFVDATTQCDRRLPFRIPNRLPRFGANGADWPARVTHKVHTSKNNFVAKFSDSESAKRDLDRLGYLS
jgi:hypothetical protein